MVFASITFLYYFLPIFLIVYFCSPKKFKNIILLLFSLLFYFYGEPKYILLMIIQVLFAYFMTLIFDKNKSKSLFIFNISFHLFLLCIFKYFNFLIGNINAILNSNISFIDIALPIGISFYTFQIISYEIDVYKGSVPVEKNLLNFATYVFLFPQLIAGPIVRYSDVKEELSNRKHSFDGFGEGVNRFIIGLSKKVIIANNIGELINILTSTSETSILLYWILAICYMLQIYFDFSGYSDIAIGLGKMIGFKFPENFNYPYVATSITDFWRRWHITLSTWFKDYVYIPLGGNRTGTGKTIRNILIVWILTGLWHGASWNFVVWGLYFGIILIIEKFLLKKYLDKLPLFLKKVYTLFIVMISFVIFSSSSMKDAFIVIKGLFDFKNLAISNSFILYYLKGYFLILVLAVIGATPLLKNVVSKLKKNKILSYVINVLEIVFVLVILLIVTSMLIDNSYNPFLYFRF